jgi:hypothetical protein
MANLANPIKARIKTDLDALVTAGTLGTADSIDLSKDALNEIYTAYPVAIVGLPRLESSEMADNKDNLRTYLFPILIIQKIENITTPTDMEDLLDAILNKFDTDYTLNGNAVAAVMPVTTSEFLKSTPDKGIIYFAVLLRAKTLYFLGS